MGKPRGYYAKWSKSDRENKLLFHLPVESKKQNKQHRGKLIDTETRLRFAGQEASEFRVTRRKGWEVQITGYKTSHGDVTYSPENTVNYTVITMQVPDGY